MAIRLRSSQSIEKQQALVSHIYDAALDENQWSDVLAKIAKAVNSEQGIMRIMNANFDNVERVYAHNKDPEWNRPYNSYYKNVDPWLKMVGLRHDFLACTHNVISDNEYKNTEFYADFVSPQDIHFGMGGFLHNSHKSKSYLSFHRSHRWTGFESDTFEFFKIIVPHMKKAVLINERTRTVDFENSLLRDSLDHCSSPLLLVNKEGEVLFMNSQAEELIKRQPGISIKQGYIYAQAVEDNRELRKLIHQASDNSTRDGLLGGGGMCFTDANKRVALSIMVTPLNPARLNSDIDCGECALLLLSSSSLKASFSTEMLISLYSFTPAEARLVEQMCRGLTLDQIADQFKLSKNTLRTQLRSSFRKTGVARQVDLVNLVNNGPLGAIRTS